MSEPRDPQLYDPDELLEDPKPVPWYRRPRVWVATGVAAVILAFIFSRGEWRGVTSTPSRQTSISDVALYSPPAAPPAPPVMPKIQTAAFAPPPPMAIPNLYPKQIDGVVPHVSRPVMLSYEVPHHDQTKTAAAGGPPEEGQDEGRGLAINNSRSQGEPPGRRYLPAKSWALAVRARHSGQFVIARTHDVSPAGASLQRAAAYF